VLAPAIGLHPPVAFAQRCQAHVAVGLGSPVHTAPAANSLSTCGVPVIAGGWVMTGFVSACAAAGRINSPIATRTADARLLMRARVKPASMTDRILRLRLDEGNTLT